MVHFLLLLVDLVSVISMEDLRSQIYLQFLPIFEKLYQFSPSIKFSLLSHAHRIRALIYYLNNDRATKLEYLISENGSSPLPLSYCSIYLEPRKQFRETIAELSTLHPSYPDIEQRSYPEIFLPWTSITSTGYFMAEVLNHHRRMSKFVKRKRSDDEDVEEEIDEDDVETIKESIAREITKKFRLHRTSASLKWSLGAISVLILQYFKTKEL